MISAGHHTMMGPAGAPSVFRYVAVKLIANSGMRSYSSGSSYYSSTSPATYVQLSEIQFQTSTGTRFSYPSGFKVCSRLAYNGVRMYQDWVDAMNAQMNTGERFGRLFDNNTSTKYYESSHAAIRDTDSSGNYRTPIINYDTGAVVFARGASIPDTDERSAAFGGRRWTPGCYVLDLLTTPLDITTYSQWCFKNANDNASQTSRTIVEAEVLGSTDMKTWWRLDIWNDINASNTNYAIVHTGNLVPRKGDIWSDLDLSTRDWTNGIAVDGI